MACAALNPFHELQLKNPAHAIFDGAQIDYGEPTERLRQAPFVDGAQLVAYRDRPRPSRGSGHDNWWARFRTGGQWDDNNRASAPV